MPSQTDAPPKPAIDRPFHIIVVLWGERFRNYFLNYCLPSLLSPGNIPALATRQRSKLVVATRPEDWEAMQATRIFRLAERYIFPVYIEIPPCPTDRSGCEHMGLGHKLACEMAYLEKAYAAVLTPDFMMADGAFARLQQLAQSGVQLVLAAALRFGEEPLFAHLCANGALPRQIGDGNPLTISCRDMTLAAINSFHSHSASCEWGSPIFPHIAHAAWWRVPNEDGILLHSLSWAPLLIDYAGFTRHDTTTMDQWTIDGDYIYKNLEHIGRIHLVQDSDELFFCSWAPLADRKVNELPILKLRPLGILAWCLQFKSHFESPIFDPLKRELFFKPVRWHSRPLNDTWETSESRAMRQLLSVVSCSNPDPEILSDPRTRLGRFIFKQADFVFRRSSTRRILRFPFRACRFMSDILRGRMTRHRLRRLITRNLDAVTGRTYQKPSP